MRKKFTKKIMPLLMAGVLVLGGSLSSVSAKGNTGIGKIALSSTTAKAITTISSASAPANGFAGYAKITAYSSSGKKATNTVMSAASKTTSTVSYKEIKANSVHKQYYMGSELTNFTMTLEKNYSKYVL